MSKRMSGKERCRYELKRVAWDVAGLRAKLQTLTARYDAKVERYNRLAACLRGELLLREVMPWTYRPTKLNDDTAESGE